MLFTLLFTLVIMTSCGSARGPKRYRGGRGRSYGGGSNVISSGTQCTLVKRPGGGGANCFSEQECGQVSQNIISMISITTPPTISQYQVCQTVSEQQCVTVSQSQCSLVSVPQCSTVNQQQCSNVPSQECSVVNEQQCSSVPSQECSQVSVTVCSGSSGGHGGGGVSLNSILQSSGSGGGGGYGSSKWKRWAADPPCGSGYARSGCGGGGSSSSGYGGGSSSGYGGGYGGNSGGHGGKILWRS